jgi:pimeloyl-ACP methyl ester carboxylesterase
MRRKTADLTLRGPGTSVGDKALTSTPFKKQRDRTVLLIHGYNVTDGDAAETLNGFRKTLENFAPDLPRNTFTCTWTGNMRSLGPAAYPFMLRYAKESATTLLEAIDEWYAEPWAAKELIIVAHSLGCRLTLEMLSAMNSKGRPPSLKKLVVILMAAAVPVEHMELEGKLRDALDVPDATIILHSQDDGVLRKWFRIGQTVALDGVWPEAVGLRGAPQSAAWAQSTPMHAFDHSDYWAELETAEQLCRILGIPIRTSSRGVPLATRKLLTQRQGAVAPLLPMFGS